MNDLIRVMVADDHHVVRQGLVALLKTVPDLQVVTEAADGQEAIERYHQTRPDVALMDLRMPTIGWR